MIITRAPMRLSFIGGRTDSVDFFRHYPSRVIATTIDKYSYVTINQPPLVKKVAARYAISELVDHPRELKNDRIRAALLHLGIESKIDIGCFSDIPVRIGFGSPSSFTVALIKGLSTHLGQRIDKRDVADIAARLEIEHLNESIGKQDHYAAALGGLNIFQCNLDESVDVIPIRLDFKKRFDFANHLLVFFTGITRLSSSVPNGDFSVTDQNSENTSKVSDLVFDFRDKLIAGDFKALGEILHENWLKEKTLRSDISHTSIDDFYSTGITHGAWGGRVLSDGGGVCVLFIVSPEKKSSLREAMQHKAEHYNLTDFGEIPIRFVQGGVEILMSHTHTDSTT